MSDLRTAAQQALEALQNCANGEDDVLLTRDALAALRAALAEPVQEPVYTDLLRLVGILFERAYEAGKAAAAEPAQEPPCATQECMPSQCPNCASLEAQNTELDRKLGEMERKPLTEAKIKKLLAESAGMTVQFGDVDLRFARAVERAHGIGGETWG